MFIERLTKEHLCEFFHKARISFYMSKSYGGEEYLYVSYDTESMTVNNRMYDFEGSTVSSENKWREFLYSIFGQEYKDAYKAYLLSEMEEKLSYLKENKDNEPELEI